jgi:D-alanyl-D-alanine dipeptidase
VGQPFRVALGKNGMAWDERQSFRPKDKAAPVKREGDGKSPAGIFPLLYAYGYDAPQQQWKFPYIQVNANTLCIDDPQSRYYNQIVSRDSIKQSDWQSYEDMRRKDDLYRLGIVVGYNIKPVQAGKGSCIFMHLSAGTPQNPKGTAGCTAMLHEEILQLLNWLKAANQPMLIQMPSAEWDAVRNALKIR